MTAYLVAAYLVFWILPFALLITIWLRQRRIEREIALLRAQLEERADEENPIQDKASRQPDCASKL